MRIAIVSQYYPPERITLVPMLARALAERGHEIRVVTGFPNYPDGKLFDGFRQRFGHDESDQGIPVRRVPLLISHSQNPLGRVLNYVSFGLSALSASRFTRDADVVYIYATQMTAAIAPAVWQRFRGQPYVLHVQDLWPESIVGANMLPKEASRIVSRTISPWLRSVYRRSAAVVGIAPTMTRTLIQRGAPKTSRTIYNWAENAGRRETTADSQQHGALRLVYGGNIGEMQDFSTVIEALALTRDLNDVHVDVYGTGVLLEDVKGQAERLGLDCVEFHGWVDTATMAEAYDQADFSLVPLKDLPVFKMTIPSKFQASMSAGIPVITTAQGDLACMIARENVGYAASPGDPASLAVAIRNAHSTSAACRAQMGRQARSLYENTMSIDAALDALEEVLKDASRTDNTRKNRFIK